MAYQVQQITNNPYQQQTIILPDGTSFLLQLYFMPMQYAWVITSLVYGTFQVCGLRVTNSPNMLHQFRNQLPFGLACFSTNNREPSQLQDFSSQASQLYVLTAAEVAEYEAFLVSGANG